MRSHIKHLLSLLLIFILICFVIIAYADSVNVGDYVYYGYYPQTEKGNDSTPIEWLVLNTRGDKIQLISRYILDCMPYQEEVYNVYSDGYWDEYWENKASELKSGAFQNPYWDQCSLRKWLQNEVVAAAVTTNEALHICPTLVKNDWREGDEPVADTTETVYLLSKNEACSDLGVVDKDTFYGLSDNRIDNIPGNRLLNLGTPYVVAKFAAHIGDPDDWLYLFNNVWWFRDTDGYSNPLVYNLGSYEQDFDFLPYGVRPVMWIDTSAPFTKH